MFHIDTALGEPSIRLSPSNRWPKALRCGGGRRVLIRFPVSKLVMRQRWSGTIPALHPRELRVLSWTVRALRTTVRSLDTGLSHNGRRKRCM